MSIPLKELLKQAAKGEYALGHFNFADSMTVKAIVLACASVKSPVFAGTSEGEAAFAGYAQAVGLRDAWRKESSIPIFLNADHHKSFERAKQAIDAGYDSVHMDGSELPLEENIAVTRRVVEYAKKANPEVSVEGELGYLRGSSGLLKKEVEIKPEDMTSPEGAKEFIRKTGIDRLAVVIGNIHGISLAGNPRLDVERLRAIHKAIPDVPLTLHGGSGIANEDILAILPFGMSNIHVNTELRVAFSNSLRETLRNNPGQTTPYAYFESPLAAVRKLVEGKLRLFGAIGRI